MTPPRICRNCIFWILAPGNYKGRCSVGLPQVEDYTFASDTCARFEE